MPVANSIQRQFSHEKLEAKRFVCINVLVGLSSVSAYAMIVNKDYVIDYVMN